MQTYSGPNKTFCDISFTAEDYDHPKTKAVRGFGQLQASLFTRKGDSVQYQLYSKVDPQISMVPQSLIQLGSRVSGMMPVYFRKQILKAGGKKV